MLTFVIVPFAPKLGMSWTSTTYSHQCLDPNGSAERQIPNTQLKSVVDAADHEDIVGRNALQNCRTLYQLAVVDVVFRWECT